LLLAGYAVEAVETECYEVHGSAEPEPTLHAQYAWRARPAVQEAELRQALATRVSDDAPTLLFHPPDALNAYAEYSGFRIGYTMLESDTLVPQWGRACRNVDALLTPC